MSLLQAKLFLACIEDTSKKGQKITLGEDNREDCTVLPS